MLVLAVTAQTWIVTGLGFGIVLALLFCLVFIMQFFGWTMQKATAPKAAHKTESAAPTTKSAPKATQASDEEKAAIAMALYLNSGKKHDQQTASIKPQARNTAWNDKSIGLNNKGF